MCDQIVTSVRPRVFLTFALLSSCCVSEYIMDCWSSVPSKPRRAEKVNNMQASHLQTCWQKECDIKNCHCWMKIYLYAYDLLMCKFSLIKVHHSFMWKDRPFLVNFGSTLCRCVSFTLFVITKPQLFPGPFAINAFSVQCIRFIIWLAFIQPYKHYRLSSVHVSSSSSRMSRRRETLWGMQVLLIAFRSPVSQMCSEGNGLLHYLYT